MIQRSNGFDGLRLVAASMVIFGHAFALTGNVVPGFFGNGVHAIGVKIFFVISGYLITRSWQSDPDPLHFWIKRALRLMPGLVAVCLLTIFVVGPIATSLSLSEYFSNSRTLGYLWNVALYPVFDLPGVFADNVYPNVVNAALWTLPVEVAMYCGVPLLIGRNRPAARILVPMAALGLLAASIYFLRIAPPKQSLIVWGVNVTQSLDIDYYFYAGASFALLRLDRFSNIFVSCAAFCLLSQIFTGAISSELALAVALPYLTISLGKTNSALLQRLHGHDFSYGIYLYGFLVQQLLVHFVGTQSAWFNALVSLIIAVVLAAFSWFAVERPALALKPDRKAAKGDKGAMRAQALDIN